MLQVFCLESTLLFLIAWKREGKVHLEKTIVVCLIQCVLYFKSKQQCSK